MRYALHLSSHIESFGKPFIPAVRANLCGHLDERGELVAPDMAAVRAALPYRYRAAFDRAGCFWFNRRDGEKPAYLELRSARGAWLNVIYAIPARA